MWEIFQKCSEMQLLFVAGFVYAICELTACVRQLVNSLKVSHSHITAECLLAMKYACAFE